MRFDALVGGDGDQGKGDQQEEHEEPEKDASRDSNNAPDLIP
jgi:hypothetical protein